MRVKVVIKNTLAEVYDEFNMPTILRFIHWDYGIGVITMIKKTHIQLTWFYCTRLYTSLVNFRYISRNKALLTNSISHRIVENTILRLSCEMKYFPVEGLLPDVFALLSHVKLQLSAFDFFIRFILNRNNGPQNFGIFSLQESRSCNNCCKRSFLLLSSNGSVSRSSEHTISNICSNPSCNIFSLRKMSPSDGVYDMLTAVRNCEWVVIGI